MYPEIKHLQPSIFTHLNNNLQSTTSLGAINMCNQLGKYFSIVKLAIQELKQLPTKHIARRLTKLYWPQIILQPITHQLLHNVNVAKLY